MTPKQQRELRQRWETAVGNVIGAARLVNVFDGTDRQSLESLGDALFELGMIEGEVEVMLREA